MSVRVGDEIVAGGQGDMYTKAQVDALIANAIAQTTEKPGMIKPFAGTTVPTGYLLCDGSAVSRTTYADLFAAIGTTYGSGDGSTTFNLPALSDYVLRGTNTLSDVSNKTNGAIPNVTGTVDAIAILNGAVATGGFTFSNKHNGDITTNSSSTYLRYKINLDASTLSAVYSNSVTYVRPKSMLTAYIIKY